MLHSESNHQELVPLEEISKRYSLPLSTLRRWASERKFPLYRISNRIRVDIQEFSDWLRQFHTRGGGNRG
jgi:helix-turn-helix protein